MNKDVIANIREVIIRNVDREHGKLKGNIYNIIDDHLCAAVSMLGQSNIERIADIKSRQNWTMVNCIIDKIADQDLPNKAQDERNHFSHPLLDGVLYNLVNVVGSSFDEYRKNKNIWIVPVPIKKRQCFMIRDRETQSIVIFISEIELVIGMLLAQKTIHFFEETITQFDHVDMGNSLDLDTQGRLSIDDGIRNRYRDILRNNLFEQMKNISKTAAHLYEPIVEYLCAAHAILFVFDEKHELTLHTMLKTCFPTLVSGDNICDRDSERAAAFVVGYLTAPISHEIEHLRADGFSPSQNNNSNENRNKEKIAEYGLWRQFVTKGAIAGSDSIGPDHMIGALTFLGLHESIANLKVFQESNGTVKVSNDESSFAIERLLPHIDLILWFAKCSHLENCQKLLTRLIAYKVIWHSALTLLAMDQGIVDKLLRRLPDVKRY